MSFSPSMPSPILIQHHKNWSLDAREGADFLEVLALLSQDGRANVASLKNAVTVQDEEKDNDIGDDDARWEDIVGQIEQTVNRRLKHNTTSYPFELDESGSVLSCRETEGGGADAYKVCLLCAYLRRHKLIGVDAPLKKLTVPLQSRVFQILVTLAMAGWADGNAVSVGYPRKGTATILDALSRAYNWGSELKPKEYPGYLANPDAKDGGVDALGWSQPSGGMVIPIYRWGQAASGGNWKGKPVQPDVVRFLADFVDGSPVNHLYATLIPIERKPDDKSQKYLEGKHGEIIDRLTLPTLYARAAILAGAGMKMDELNCVQEVADWIDSALTGLRDLYA